MPHHSYGTPLDALRRCRVRVWVVYFLTASGAGSSFRRALATKPCPLSFLFYPPPVPHTPWVSQYQGFATLCARLLPGFARRSVLKPCQDFAVLPPLAPSELAWWRFFTRGCLRYGSEVFPSTHHPHTTTHIQTHLSLGKKEDLRGTQVRSSGGTKTRGRQSPAASYLLQP